MQPNQEITDLDYKVAIVVLRLASAQLSQNPAGWNAFATALDGLKRVKLEKQKYGSLFA